MKLSFLAVILIAFTATGTSAQGLALPPGKALPTQYVQTRWTKQDGLPQSSVAALVQTRAGYVWFGTQEGLVRFDGQRFSVYLSSQHPGLPSNDVTALLEGPDGALWVGTSGGLARYDGRRFEKVEALADVGVRALYPDGTRLWVGTLEGLVHLDGDVAHRYSVDEGLPSPIVLSLGTDAKKRLWVGTLAGAARFDRGRLLPAPSLSDGEVRALHRTPDGRLLAGTGKGVSVLRGDVFVPFTPEGAAACPAVSSLTTDAQGVLWVGTSGHGLCALIDGAFHSLPASELPDGLVRTLTPDAEGGLWVGLDLGGLLRLHQGPFLTLGAAEGLATNSALTVLEDRQGALWVGTDGGGLQRFYRGAVTHYGKGQGLTDQEERTDGQILSILETEDGTLWAAPGGGGACRLEGNRFRCLTTREGLSSNFVTALHQSADGTIWIGTDRGIHHFAQGRLSSVSHLHPSLERFQITSIVSKGSEVWIGTYGGGIVRVQNGQAQSIDHTSGLARPEVLSLHLDGEGRLWAGLHEGGGLCRLGAWGGRFSCYSSADGLPSNNVLQVLTDDEGFIWVGSNQGIVRIPLTSFSAYDGGLLRTLPVERVGTTPESGLRDPEVNGGLQPTSWLGRDGTRYFATVAGVGILTSGAFDHRFNKRPPPVYIESVRLNGTPVEGTNPVLPPHPRDLRFDFSALSFQNPDSVRIRYRLDGFDDAWHMLEGRERSYTYSSLNAGTYTFRVQAANADGVWNETGATYTFRVRAHPTETWWFYLLCVLVALGIGAALSRARVRVLEKQRQQLEATVADRTAELRAHEAELRRVNEGLEQEVQRQFAILVDERHRYETELITARDKAEASARLKSTMLDNMSHEFRTPIAAILGSAEILKLELQGDLREFADHIDAGGKRLLTTLNNVLDLSRLESQDVQLHPSPFDAGEKLQEVCNYYLPTARQKKIALHVEAESPLVVELDLSALETIYHNLLSNAIKFTDCGAVHAAVGRVDNGLRLTVRDTGIGIHEAFLPHLFEPFKQESDGLARTHEGTGIGLTIVKGYVEAMGGTLDVSSTSGEGTTFTVWVPQHSDGDGIAQRAELLTARA